MLGGASLVVDVIVGTLLFVPWAIWMLFPLVMYFQLRGVLRHADLIEVNLRLRESNQAAAKITLEAAAEVDNPFGR